MIAHGTDEQSLEYESVPDYDWLDQTLAAMTMEARDVSQHSYEDPAFSWVGGSDKLQTTSGLSNDRDATFKLKVLTSRAKYLLPTPDLPLYEKKMKRPLSSMQLAKAWKLLVHELMQDVPINIITPADLQAFDRVLLAANHFFDVSFTDENGDWQQFLFLQKVCRSIQCIVDLISYLCGR